MAEPRWLRVPSLWLRVPSLWLRVLYVAVAVMYPVLIYFGLQALNPRWLTLLLLVIATRHVMGKSFPPALRAVWGLCVVALVGITLITGSDTGLLMYPVMMSGLMFVLFFGSWLKPPTVIEMIARMRDPQLPEEAIRYTRKLTLVWCAFFIVNGGIALATVTMSREWWTLYNGLVSYLLLGALFFGELIFRRRLLAQPAQSAQ
jgi:uncharacterized membrane protein